MDIDAVSLGTAFTYEFGSDSYADPQDGAKLTWVPARLSLTNSPGIGVSGSHIKMNVHHDSGSALFVWDVWHGPEWRSITCTGGKINVTEQLVRKQYRLRFLNAGANTGDGGITIEVKELYINGDGNPASGSCSDVTTVSMRSYIGPPPAGLIGSDPLTNLNPPGEGTVPYQSFTVKHSTWTRYWLEVQLNVDASAFTSWNAEYMETVAPGTYHMVSLWMADETREPVRIYYKMPYGRLLPTAYTTVRDEIGIFDLEMDTSSKHYKANGFVTFTGAVEGAPVPSGTQIQTIAGVRYGTQGTVNISGGTATVAARALDSYSGEIGNAAVGTDLTTVNVVPDIDSAVETTTAFTGGAYINTGTLYSYFRNWVLLKDYELPANPEDDTVIFRKPVPDP